VTSRPTVAVDCLPESVARHRSSDAIVAVDVIRATTTAVTGLVAGRRCFPVASLEDAVIVSRNLENPLLVGEVNGDMPGHFEITNSPAQLAWRSDVHRPMILLSTSGTRLICAAAGTGARVYAACLRNVSAQVERLAGRYRSVSVIGAGSRGEFRPEDQLCCARVAAGLIDAGYEPADEETAATVERWRDAPTESIVGGASAEYLRRTGQLHDLDFILAHVDDVGDCFVLEGEELVAAANDA
jgi:2-phosphosulfolactate phosphatase